MYSVLDRWLTEAFNHGNEPIGRFALLATRRQTMPHPARRTTEARLTGGV